MVEICVGDILSRESWTGRASKQFYRSSYPLGHYHPLLFSRNLAVVRVAEGIAVTPWAGIPLSMTITATAAIFIRDLNHGNFSFFHLFVPLTYWGVFGALWNVRRRDIHGHKRAMLDLYIGGHSCRGCLDIQSRSHDAPDFCASALKSAGRECP